MIYEIGRLCVKIAGRDSNKTCVIVDVVDESNVLIDGQTRRRKCNVKHLEPLEKVIKLHKGASHADVKKAFSELELDVRETKPKKAEQKPKKAKAVKEYASPDKKSSKDKTGEKKEKAPKKAAVKKAKPSEKKSEE